MIVSGVVPCDSRWLLRFIGSGWILHSQQPVTGQVLAESSQSSQFSSCCLDCRWWSPVSLGPQWCETEFGPPADSWGAETSTTSGCWVRRRAPGSCSTRRCVPWRSEGLRRGGNVFVGMNFNVKVLLDWCERLSLTIWTDRSRKV